MDVQDFLLFVINEYKNYLEMNKKNISKSNQIIDHKKILELESRNLVEYNSIIEKQLEIYWSDKKLKNNIVGYNIITIKDRQKLDLDFIEFIINHNENNKTTPN
ncbi:hypothetical protein [Empedobacter stercoris]|uniref:hypothetical protein n=1 Tax=Empedobacter stercoris TaxID=1628248 RepID=UPI0039E96357